MNAALAIFGLCLTVSFVLYVVMRWLLNSSHTIIQWDEKDFDDSPVAAPRTKPRISPDAHLGGVED